MLQLEYYVHFLWVGYIIWFSFLIVKGPPKACAIKRDQWIPGLRNTNIVVKNTSWVVFQLYYFLVMWPCVSHLTSLSLSFLRITIVPSQKLMKKTECIDTLKAFGDRDSKICCDNTKTSLKIRALYILALEIVSLSDYNWWFYTRGAKSWVSLALFLILKLLLGGIQYIFFPFYVLSSRFNYWKHL